MKDFTLPNVSIHRNFYDYRFMNKCVRKNLANRELIRVLFKRHKNKSAGTKMHKYLVGRFFFIKILLFTVFNLMSLDRSGLN